MDTDLPGLDAFDSEVAPPPRQLVRSTRSAGAGVLMRVVDAHPGRNSYEGSSRRPRHFERTLTVGRLVASTLRAVGTMAVFPFVVIGWFLARLWWLVRLLLRVAWHVVISAPASAVRWLAASARATLAPPPRLRESPPVVRVAIAGVPAWARDVPLVPAIAFALTATAGISVALALLLLRL